MWPVRKADNLPSSCAVVMKSGNLNFLEPFGPIQACNGTALNIYYNSTVNTQHMQGPDVLLQLGYTWRHVSAFKRPFSGQFGVILLR